MLIFVLKQNQPYPGKLHKKKAPSKNKEASHLKMAKAFKYLKICKSDGREHIMA